MAVVVTKVQESASALRAEQVQQVEELLFSGPPRAGFAKALFRGEFRGKAIFPYPELTESERPAVEDAVAAVRRIRRHAHRRRRDRPRRRHSRARSSTGWPSWA